MVKEVNLSIIILNYNICELLRQCLELVKKARRDSFKTEVIVVDNASTDNSPRMVEKEFPEVILVESKKNLGFAAGNNLGIKKAEGEYILLLNPDTQVFPETFKTMINFLEKNSEVGIATCRVELLNGQLDDACHRGFPTPWRALCHFSSLEKIFPKSRFFNGYHLGYQNLDKIHEIDACSGAFMMIRRRVGDSLGWLDEDYFWYGEDLDFCYRAKKAGWKVMFIPLTKILHWKGAASGMKKESQEVSTATLETRRRVALASTGAMRIFYRKHYQEKYPKIITWLVFWGINLLKKIRLSRI